MSALVRGGQAWLAGRWWVRIAGLAGTTLAGVGGAATISALVPVHAQGRVVDAQGSPVPAASVELVAATGQVGAGRTDAQGHFSLLGGLHIAATDLVASAPGFAPARLPHSTAQVVLHRWPVVTGRAQDDEGNGLPAATVDLNQDRGRGLRTTVTDASGNFLFDGRLEPGGYHLSVTALYHDPFRTTLGLAYDQPVQLEAALPRHLSSISLTSQPDGQRPLLDGAPLPGCALTPCTTVIPAGPHIVAIESELYVPWQQEIWPTKGDSLNLGPVLERKTGTLTIAAPDVPASQLLVDGSPVGTTSWTGKLPTGEHRIEFTSARTWPFSGAVRVEWNAETSISVAAVQIVPGDARAFISGLSAYLAGLDGSYGVYLEELGTGFELGYGDRDTMDAASVIKLPVALYLYHQADLGAIKLDDHVTLQEDDFMAGSGLLYYENEPGDSFSYTQLVRLLIQQSDNTAWRALVRVLGGDQVDAYSASLGGSGCNQATDTCTARAAGRLLVQLGAGTALNGTSTSALIGLLETTDFNDRINYFLGDIPIAHKVGMKGGVINDSGIVYLAGDPFVISVFTDTDDPDLGVQVIRDVARAAAAFFGR